MQALPGFAPLVAFFVAYTLRGLYVATAVLMVAMVALVAFEWWRKGKVPVMHAASALLVLVLGGATLLLHNRLFIQWKPTILFWAVSIAFIVSGLWGERSLTERMLGPALEPSHAVGAAQWRRANAGSAAFYALLGALNLAVAYGASERAWVYFKLFGLAVLTFVFVALQAWWLTRRAAPAGGGPAAEASP